MPRRHNKAQFSQSEPDVCNQCGRDKRCTLCFDDPEDSGKRFKYYTQNSELPIEICCISSMIMILAGLFEMRADIRWIYAPHWFAATLGVMAVGIVLFVRNRRPPKDKKKPR